MRLKTDRHCKLKKPQLINNMLNHMFFIRKNVYQSSRYISSCVYM